MTLEQFQADIRAGIPDVLPEPKPYDATVNHAPKRKEILTREEKVLAIKNALRYFPEKHHATLAPEFAEELEKYGRIYMYRLRPDYEMYARPIEEYPAKSRQAAAMMLMIQNNLDKAVAQHPHELITYGGNGAVFQNWAQYRLAMKYLSEMTDEQTLVMYSGHPMGLFPSSKDAPRAVITNGMVIPNYSKPDDWERMNALGVSQYGQMTAGSWMYIGPQGIVHGTTITVLNAGRRRMKEGAQDLGGMLFVSAGLGGMSGAQPKAGNIAGVVSIVAEINPAAVNKLAERGMYFFDYGNAFLLEASRAGADVLLPNGKFRYPSYVQDIMGPLFFDYGFGPFRWVCASGKEEDLDKSDEIAARVLEEIRKEAPEEILGQLDDNIHWIKEAKKNRLVVGSSARILYADSEGRIKIASAFNEAIAKGEISAPIVLGRDHHDVSGTDSPYRETSNIYDGSAYTADMAVHNVVGDGFRGATWVSLHNGGGVGWGEVINGGFGMVIDGSPEAQRRIENMLLWDTNNGIARRSWARNSGAMSAIRREMERTPNLKVTMPNVADDKLIEQFVK